MVYHFRNLVFEGGGVKGIAYVGALQVLEEKGILPGITRVGGTSAGAINAVLLGLNFTPQETLHILNKLDFKKFMDDDLGAIRDTKRLLNEFGWHKGDFFREWISDLIKTVLDAQSNQHLHSDDWQRTIYVDTLGVKTTEFKITDAKKKALVYSGRKGTETYFKWFDNPASEPANRV